MSRTTEQIDVPATLDLLRESEAEAERLKALLRDHDPAEVSQAAGIDFALTERWLAPDPPPNPDRRTVGR